MRNRTKIDAHIYGIKVNGVPRYYGVSRSRPGRRTGWHIAVAERLLRGMAHRYARNVHYKLAEAIKNGEKITTVVVISGLTEADAYKIEKRRIAETRKRAPNQLWNVSRGGSGWPKMSGRQRKKWAADIAKTMAIVASTPEARAMRSKNTKLSFDLPGRREIARDIIIRVNEEHDEHLRAGRRKHWKDNYDANGGGYY